MVNEPIQFPIKDFLIKRKQTYLTNNQLFFSIGPLVSNFVIATVDDQIPTIAT